MTLNGKSRLKIRHKFLLCIAPICLCLVDQTITLIGQTSAYWEGDYSTANEINPWFRWLLMQHPLAFEAGILLWIILFTGLILVVPSFVSKVFSVAIVLGHTWGTSSWLCWKFDLGYWFLIGLFLLSSIAIVVSWDIFQKKQSNFFL